MQSTFFFYSNICCYIQKLGLHTYCINKTNCVPFYNSQDRHGLEFHQIWPATWFIFVFSFCRCHCWIYYINIDTNVEWIISKLNKVMSLVMQSKLAIILMIRSIQNINYLSGYLLFTGHIGSKTGLTISNLPQFISCFFCQLSLLGS